MRSRLMLLGIAIGSIGALGAYFAFVPARQERVPPPDLDATVRWLQQHPADWVAASVITEHALDSNSPQRFALWRTAHSYARRMAPWRSNPEIAFVRGGLFHWYELPAADRSAVVAAATPLLRNPASFRELYVPLFELTRNMPLLRRSNPGTLDVLTDLQRLALTYGLIADYESLREEIRQKRLEDFANVRGTIPPSEISRHLPTRIEHDDEPLLLAIIEELHRRPLDAEPAVSMDEFIDYAIRHDLGPLDGLEYLTIEAGAGDPTRARLALQLGHADRASEIEHATAESAVPVWQPYHLERAEFESLRHDHHAASIHLMKAALGGRNANVLAAYWHIDHDSQAGDELTRRYTKFGEWQGLCGTDVCTSARAWLYSIGPSPAKVVLEPVQSDEWPPYVECFLDDVRVAQTPVQAPIEIQLNIPKSGLHRIEIRIANPLTRNLIQRRIRVVQ